MYFHTITDITKTKKGRYALFIDGEFLFSVDDETLYENSITISTKLSEEQLLDIKQKSDYRYAKKKALQLLSFKSYTKHDLIQRLSRNVDTDVAIDATERMIELGLIDDLDYAMRYSRDLFNLKKYSVKRIELELKQKGICEEYILEAISQFDDVNVENQIHKIIVKKYISKLDDEKGKRRAVNGLIRLGYNYCDINTVIKNLQEDINYYNYDIE